MAMKLPKPRLLGLVIFRAPFLPGVLRARILKTGHFSEPRRLRDAIAFEDAGRCGGLNIASGQDDTLQAVAARKFENMKAAIRLLESVAQFGETMDRLTIDLMDNDTPLVLITDVIWVRQNLRENHQRGAIFGGVFV